MRTNHRITLGVLLLVAWLIVSMCALYGYGWLQAMSTGRVGGLYFLVHYGGTGIKPFFVRYDDVIWAEVAPRGGAIAFELGRSRPGMWYVADLPSGRARLIASHAGSFPSWASDERRIAFIQKRSIRVTDTDSGKSRIVHPGGKAIPYAVRLSPRGDNLALGLKGANPALRQLPDLWVLRAKDLSWRRLARQVGSFDWSSDARKIVYATLSSKTAFLPGGKRIERPIETGIRVVSLDSGESTFVASGGGGPHFVLDDRAVLFDSGSSPNRKVWLVTVGRRPRPKLVAKGDIRGWVVPSPSGNEVAYQEGTGRLIVVDLRWDRHWIVGVVPLAGQLSWSPNGDEIVFPWPPNGVWSVPARK